MGTNYYLLENECKCCGRFEKRHIGKSSGGWAFALHVYPKDNIVSLEDWQKTWRGKRIVDEYDNDISEGDLITVITQRKRVGNQVFTQEFLNLNNAIFDVEINLLRYNYINCAGHGPGTWDYIDADFS